MASIAEKAPPLPCDRPRSAVSTGVGLSGLAGLIAWLLVARHFGMSGPDAALLCLAACGVPMVLWSIGVDRVHRNPSTGIAWDTPLRPLSATIDISLTKIAGLWATWTVIACIYALCRFYWAGDYVFAMRCLLIAAPILFVASPIYVIWLDRRLTQPRDGAWVFGHWLMGQKTGSRRADRAALADHFRTWAVKGFFVAFMLSIVPGGFYDVVSRPWADVVRGPVALAGFLISFMFVIDVAMATVGYILTMRPLDAHIRSATPYASGWIAALICYPPFILMNGGGPLDYHVGTMEWSYWFDGNAALLWIWGGTLVLLTAIYAWATVAFGLRFSNLTNRGILTHGPYAFARHPAYLSKNAFWWLSTLPFFVTTGSLTDAVRNTAVLAVVSGVYWWRAKTEERHLSADPAYRAYSLWIANRRKFSSRPALHWPHNMISRLCAVRCSASRYASKPHILATASGAAGRKFWKEHERDQKDSRHCNDARLTRGTVREGHEFMIAASQVLDRVLVLEMVRVTEAAAIAASTLIGRGDEKAADAAAVEAMRAALNELYMDGTVVIGEGERDEAPMLYIGEKVGSAIGKGPRIDIALDPLEGTTITAKAGPNALAVLAVAEHGNLLNAPDVYMDKLAVGPGYPEGIIDLARSPTENVHALAAAKGVAPNEIIACVLDRPRHAQLISELRAIGCGVMLIGDGDVAGVIATADPDTTIDIYMGAGGAPEGVLAAAALRCVGGQFKGRLLFRNDDERARARKWGIDDLDHIYDLTELAKGDCIFAATGVTDGSLLDGVKRLKGGKMTTNSVVMRASSGTVRWVKGEHRKPI